MSDPAKCACGKEKEDSSKRSCSDCFKKWKNAQNVSSSTNNAAKTANHSSPPAGLPTGYLSGGYFEKKNDKDYLREEVFIEWAKKVSQALQAQKMTSAATRRFFNKLRAVEYEYKNKQDKDFDRVREKLSAFPRDVAYTENRGVTPHLFTRFIELNIAQAKESPKHFDGFIEHFQSVIAYFPKDKNN